ncbi:hypothetical protein AB0D83_34590 [Streptomyces decoyicus]|uniref:hypothetical protein n=1 Tax=Streptomyces decoyicus TaxID=249567 RepID=UPI0033F18B51
MINYRAPAAAPVLDDAPAAAPVHDDAPSALPVHDDAPPVTGSVAGRSAVDLRVGGALPGPIAAGA